MDAIFPAVVGAGIYLMFYAWESHAKGTVPHPVKKITSAIQGVAYSEEYEGIAPLGPTAPLGGTPQPVYRTPNPAGGYYPTGAA